MEYYGFVLTVEIGIFPIDEFLFFGSNWMKSK